ncbi:hypothetical protein ABEB36_013276 [Hypothenemus hampei]|uniref:Reelin domain-containing protein n=1 Tax=Hypothenemus hampei TaxID=57062 RepID=A0ABD1E7G6_HYPHA
MSKFISVVLFSLIATVWSYQVGAPETTCSTMTPSHGVAAQKSPFPYKISLNKKSVKANEIVNIQIQGKPFKGLLLQVRDSNQNAVGSFRIPATDSNFKAINCHGQKQSAATHKNPSFKKDSSLDWQAPAEPGTYNAYATVVAENGYKFWVAQPIGTITVN